MLIVYHHKKITIIPDKAIVDFWKIENQAEHNYNIYNFISSHNVIELQENDDQNHSILTKDQRYNILTTEFKNIAYLASMDHSSFSIVRGKLAEMDQLLRPTQENATIIPKIGTILNPRRVKSKGRPSNKSKRSFNDVRTKKRNTDINK